MHFNFLVSVSTYLNHKGSPEKDGCRLHWYITDHVSFKIRISQMQFEIYTCHCVYVYVSIESI